MKVIRSMIVGAAIAASQPANAWFFQPPPEAVTPETLNLFQEGAVRTLYGLGQVHFVFMSLEQEERPIGDLEGTFGAIDTLQSANALFSEIARGELDELIIPLEEIRAYDLNAFEVVARSRIQSAGDLADYVINTNDFIITSLFRLVEQDFGPEQAASSEGRAEINLIARAVADLIVVANSVSGALATQYE